MLGARGRAKPPAKVRVPSLTALFNTVRTWTQRGTPQKTAPAAPFGAVTYRSLGA
jgi:hypothetical protein